MSFLIRQCAPKDMKDLMRFVREIAGLYCVPVDTIRIKEEDLKEAGFGKHPRYECFVAEVPPEQKTKEGHTLIGYILSVYTYSIWRGKNLYIDNLYVMPEFRGKLIGDMLFLRAAEAAWLNGCTQLRMHTSSQKPENLDFLFRRGGEDLTVKEGWQLLRFYEESLRKMAAQSKF
ncbi:diamine acetyltransferase 1-like isoform X1 [Hemicordylus capensis]|uniref:diamine acetyltransferase 1-like isoform X1 n=1 Tax=Hemicordylus capensis TaxID=884348 RepID=UPI0023048B71|nr:diamine acetyltransferase 1-like isoform X1 [Hemicordylus capensis]